MLTLLLTSSHPHRLCQCHCDHHLLKRSVTLADDTGLPSAEVLLNLYVILLSITSNVWSSFRPWAAMPLVNSLWLINRVSNRKSRSMQISVVSSRPTLGKIETTLQIGYALGKVRDNAILNHTCKYKKRLRDQHHVHMGRSTS